MGYLYSLSQPYFTGLGQGLFRDSFLKGSLGYYLNSSFRFISLFSKSIKYGLILRGKAQGTSNTV